MGYRFKENGAQGHRPPARVQQLWQRVGSRATPIPWPSGRFPFVSIALWLFMGAPCLPTRVMKTETQGERHEGVVDGTYRRTRRMRRVRSPHKLLFATAEGGLLGTVWIFEMPALTISVVVE